VTLKRPGIFSRQVRTIPFKRIYSVDADCPLESFYTITIQTMGPEKINAHGFTMSDVVEMKKSVL
jgi:hypothetical protein